MLGEEHPETLASINNMGLLLRAQGKLAEAEPYWREALEKSRRVLGEEHPHTLTSINNMGVLLLNQRRLAEAEPYSREAMEKARRLLGTEHPDALVLLHNLISLLMMLDRFADAAPWAEECIKGNTNRFGPAHKYTRRAIAQAVTLYEAWDKAEPGKGYDAKAAEWKARLDAIPPPDDASSK